MDIKLTKMDSIDFIKFIEIATKNYAEEKIENGSWDESFALEKAKKDFSTLLVDDENTENNILKNILVDEKNIGYIWYSINNEEIKEAYLYEIFISEDGRGKGIGTEVMKISMKELKEKNIENFRLHVFGHNQSALKFYKKLGFEITDYNLNINIDKFNKSI